MDIIDFLVELFGTVPKQPISNGGPVLQTPPRTVFSTSGGDRLTPMPGKSPTRGVPIYSKGNQLRPPRDLPAPLIPVMQLPLGKDQDRVNPVLVTNSKATKGSSDSTPVTRPKGNALRPGSIGVGKGVAGLIS